MTKENGQVVCLMIDILVDMDEEFPMESLAEFLSKHPNNYRNLTKDEIYYTLGMAVAKAEGALFR